VLDSRDSIETPRWCAPRDARWRVRRVKSELPLLCIRGTGFVLEGDSALFSGARGSWWTSRGSVVCNVVRTNQGPGICSAQIVAHAPILALVKVVMLKLMKQVVSCQA